MAGERRRGRRRRRGKGGGGVFERWREGGKGGRWNGKGAERLNEYEYEYERRRVYR